MNIPERNGKYIVIVAIVGAVAPTIAATASLLVAWNTRDTVVKTAAQVDRVEKQTNSMKDALVASTRKESLQEGKDAGKKEGRAAGIAEEKSKHFFK